MAKARGETVGSLRAYFLFVAVWSALSNITVIASEAPGLSNALNWVGLVLSIAIAYVGLRLKYLIAAAPATIERVFFVAGALILARAVSLFLGGAIVAAVVQLLIGWLLLVYLVTNIRRLTAIAVVGNAASGQPG
jgi:hypothetical protein